MPMNYPSAGEQAVEDILAEGVPEASIAKRPTSYNRTIFADENYVYAIDREGNIVVGGEDSVNVSDNTDFAELLKTVVNNYVGEDLAIWVVPNTIDDYIRYQAKSAGHTLNRVFTMAGGGGNRSRMNSESATLNSTIFTVDGSISGDDAILELQNLKFHDPDRTDLPNMWFDFTNISELGIFNCEFRDCQNYGIKATNISGWNYLSHCWFLQGAGYRIDGATDLHLTANKHNGSNTNCEVLDCDNVMELGTTYRDDAPKIDFQNCHFDKPYQQVDSAKKLEGDLLVDYGFNAGQGSTLFDATVNNRHGSLENTPTWVSDSERGQVLSFDPTNNEYVDTGVDSPFDLSAPFTICADFKLNSGASSKKHAVLGKFDGDGYMLRADTVSTVYNLWFGGSPHSSGLDSLDIGNFHPICIGFDGSEVVFWRDGVFLDAQSTADTVSASTSNLYIGQRGDSDEYANISVNRISMYDRLLSDGEVKKWSYGYYIPQGKKITALNRTVSADGMTANPESASEDGFIEVEIDGTLYQVPVYSK